MNFEQLHAAVIDAHRQGHSARCTELMDQFIHTARGVELGHALCLKAAYLLHFDTRRCSEGLNLIEEALALGSDDPVLLMNCATDGLGLCYICGDTERARRYEHLAFGLLKQHADDPTVNFRGYRLYGNLAHIASLRQEHTQAYWNLVQGTQSLLATPEESEEKRCALLGFYLRTAEVCVDMGRTPEAGDALHKARAYVSPGVDEADWRIRQGEYLLATAQLETAAESLDDLLKSVEANWRPNIVVRLHLIRSLVAQAQGDVRTFHHHLAQAQLGAVKHALDYLLCRIQRMFRTPIRMEAVR